VVISLKEQREIQGRGEKKGGKLSPRDSFSKKGGNRAEEKERNGLLKLWIMGGGGGE